MNSKIPFFACVLCQGFLAPCYAVAAEPMTDECNCKPCGSPELTPKAPPVDEAKIRTWPFNAEEIRRVTPKSPLFKPPKVAFGSWGIRAHHGRNDEKTDFVTLKALENANVTMPSGTSWSCTVTPIDVRGNGPSVKKAPAYWIVSRKLRCSRDFWNSFIESSIAIFAYNDGRLDNPSDQLHITLQEPNADPVYVTLWPPGDSQALTRKVYLPPELQKKAD